MRLFRVVYLAAQRQVLFLALHPAQQAQQGLPALLARLAPLEELALQVRRVMSALLVPVALRDQQAPLAQQAPPARQVPLAMSAPLAPLDQLVRKALSARLVLQDPQVRKALLAQQVLQVLLAALD